MNLKKNELLSVDQIRHEGGGRHGIVETKPEIEMTFLKVIEGHIAGDPMNEKIRWLKLTRAEVCEQMLSFGIKVSRNIVRKLMKKHRLVKRKMQRKRSIGRSNDREEQFNNIAAEKELFMKSKNPIISMD